MKESTEFQYFKAWLLFFLIATVGGGIIGMIIGSFVAAFLGAGGMSLPQMTRILQVVGFVHRYSDFVRHVSSCRRKVSLAKA